MVLFPAAELPRKCVADCDAVLSEDATLAAAYLHKGKDAYSMRPPPSSAATPGHTLHPAIVMAISLLMSRYECLDRCQAMLCWRAGGRLRPRRRGRLVWSAAAVTTTLCGHNSHSGWRTRDHKQCRQCLQSRLPLLCPPLLQCHLCSHHSIVSYSRKQRWASPAVR